MRASITHLVNTAGSRLCHLFEHNVTHTHVLSHNFFPFSQTFSSSLSLSHTVHSNCQAWWMRSVLAVSLTVAASDRLPNLPQIKISSLTDWFIYIHFGPFSSVGLQTSCFSAVPSTTLTNTTHVWRFKDGWDQTSLKANAGKTDHPVWQSRTIPSILIFPWIWQKH